MRRTNTFIALNTESDSKHKMDNSTLQSKCRFDGNKT